ncbi:MFS transporter [Pseudomonas aeruginosa]|uniref:MFS transporter n=17 Tax=Pseudomonas aeruginosa TaxID=287 RepID=UPI0035A1C38C
MPTANPPGRTLWLMAAIVLVGLNLRPSMAAVGPLLNAMRGEIALSFGDVSLLTALPVLTLGLGMFFGLGIARRVGEWRSVALALLLIGAASALRLGSRGLPDLLGSAMLAGLGIALIQALMPALIKARFGARTPLCMGLYVTAIMAGAALSAPAAPPPAPPPRPPPPPPPPPPPTLAEHAGWRLGLGAWAALAALALLAWWLQPGTRLRLPDAQPGRSLLRYPRTWLLVLFFGLGTACYTCVLAWLAPYYLEQGWSAQESGLLLGFLTAMEVLSGLLAPALASRSRDRRPVLVGLTALMLAGFLGLAWAPASLPLLWALCLGLGIGGLFPMGLIVCLDHFDAPQRAGQLAALVQGAGYLIAGVSPWIAGLLRDSLGSFTGAWLGLATVAALLLGLGLRFDPRRYAALFDERQPQGVGAESLR